MTQKDVRSESFWLRLILILSVVITVTIAFLILGPRPEGIEGRLDVSFLPRVNASLNGLTTILLIVAYLLIRQKKIHLHRRFMLTAFGTSALFLVTYVIYHWFKSGPAHYTGDWPAVYFLVLISHIILAAIILPLAMVTLYRGWNMHVEKHKKIAKITLPLWLYVSVTGVIIYLMLYG